MPTSSTFNITVDGLTWTLSYPEIDDDLTSVSTSLPSYDGDQQFFDMVDKVSGAEGKIKSELIALILTYVFFH